MQRIFPHPLPCTLPLHCCGTAPATTADAVTVSGLFAAVNSSTSTKQGLHKQHTPAGTTTTPAAAVPAPAAAAPAAAAAAAPPPSLQDLQALVAASGVALSNEQLVEWRVGCRTWASQIEKDIHRTFPGHEWWVGRGGGGAAGQTMQGTPPFQCCVFVCCRVDFRLFRRRGGGKWNECEQVGEWRLGCDKGEMVITRPFPGHEW